MATLQLSLPIAGMPPEEAASATISACGTYRYDLARRWPTGRRLVNWIMLNPSTADATHADPTMTRCVNFAKSWGYAGIVITNLYAFRATDPRELWKRSQADRIGPENQSTILWHATRADLIVCAWGAEGLKGGRGPQVRQQILEAGGVPHCLGMTSKGQPRHPLYLRGDLFPRLWLPKNSGRPA